VEEPANYIVECISSRVMCEEFILGFLKGVISLFIIVDPFGNIPIFIGLTKDMGEDERWRTFRNAVAAGFSLLLAFAVAGRWVLEIFGIRLYSFKIAGGALLLALAFDLLTKGKVEEKPSPEESGVVPLGIPLLAGPGAITTTIVTLETIGPLVTLSSVLAVAAITWLILKFTSPIYKILGKTGTTIISKVMAMLLAAIAVQYILEGVTEYLKS